MKIFPPHVIALNNANLQVQQGSVHAIVGENGAGKSTLMHVLYGLISADSGITYYQGKKTAFSSSRHAVQAGIGMVHQEFMLIPSYSVLENVILGSESCGFAGVLKRSEARDTLKTLMQEYQLVIDMDERIARLSVAAQQKVEIIKVLYRNAETLILDEPTAVLAPQEVTELFKRLRFLADNGKTVVFISHKLNEVLHISDMISVMRAGSVVWSGKNEQLTRAELAEKMLLPQLLGKKKDLSSLQKTGYGIHIQEKTKTAYQELLQTEKQSAHTALELYDVSGTAGDSMYNVSFAVRSGEVVGIAGVEGNGQHALVTLLTGDRRPHNGRIIMSGVDVTTCSFMQRRQYFAYVPQDRRIAGSCQSASIIDNVIMTHHRCTEKLTDTHQLFLRNGECRQFAKNIIQSFNVRYAHMKQPVGTLSGGNQQKSIIGRECALGRTLLILDQPTRGLDVAAAAYIHQLIMDIQQNGGACLLISADLDELEKLATRLLVMYQGKIAGEFPFHDRIEIGRYMLGAQKD